MSTNIKEIRDENFSQTVGSGTVLVDFWAPWCGPCRAQGPIVEKVAEQVGAKAIVAKVNVDENQATTERFGVSGIPTLIVFKDGKPVQRFVGVQNLETLVQAIGSAAEQ